MILLGDSRFCAAILESTVTINLAPSNLTLLKPRTQARPTMTEQCCLCLSCGAPFFPEGSDFNPATNIGNVSMRYIDSEFRSMPELNELFENPKFMGKREGAHVFHQSHHAHAIEYVVETLERDMNIRSVAKLVAMTLNAEWHRTHPMLAPATFQERVAWHREHTKHCGRRNPPTDVAVLEQEQ